MGSLFSQTSRMGRLSTVLGTDVLALMRFDGREAMNALFDWQVDCLAISPDIDFDALIGTHATVTLLTRQGERPFDGIVTEARWLGAGDNGHRYRLTLRPWFHLASLRRNQRIFHHKTVVQILEELLSAYAGAGPLQVSLSSDYPELEYTVQYRETDKDFACRMMERHGISYHFQHSAGLHKMVLTDAADSHPSIGARPFHPDDGHHQEDIDHFWEWHPARRITTGAIRLTDYNFKTPNAAMETDHTGDAAYAEGQIESFDWPGDYPDNGRGRIVARLRTDGERGQDRRLEAVGDIAALGAGCRVTLSGDPVPGTGDDYMCLTATHSYTSDNYGSGGLQGDGYAYSGHYVLMPATAPMVPERKTARADVKGPQTAVVVGEGEIDCDEYGRILVRFHWDLDAAHSMRCRVSQNWAGNGWGGMIIPRIGMEVLVEFLDGDPDQPLVTGCVFNGRNKVPYPLPEHKTRSTFRTDTHNGTGFNELRFEDEAGREEIFMRAQKDLTTKVENHATARIDHNKVTSIGGMELIETGGSTNRNVGENYTVSVGTGQTGVTVRGHLLDNWEGIRSSAYYIEDMASLSGGGGNYTLTATGAINMAADKSLTLSVGTAASLSVGGMRTVTIGKNEARSISQNSTEIIGRKKVIDAHEEIVLRSGLSQIRLQANGTVTISGTNLIVEEGKSIKMTAPRIDLN